MGSPVIELNDEKSFLKGGTRIPSQTAKLKTNPSQTGKKNKSCGRF